MNRIMRTLALAAVGAMLTGCMAGSMVKKGNLAMTDRIAIVSVVMPRIADTARKSNAAMLQAMADRALGKVHAELTSVRTWTVIDPAAYAASPAVMSMTAISPEEIDVMFPNAAEAKSAGDAIARELSRWEADFIGVKGLPIVPHEGLVPKKGDKTALFRIPHFMRRHAARLCSELDVDAVVFVHIAASISHPRAKTFIVSNNRTDGTLHAAQTMVIVDRSGRIVADMGRPALDDRARSRELLPLYLGTGQDAIKTENIDLGDSGNKILRAFSALIDETASDMVQGFKAAAQK